MYTPFGNAYKAERGEIHSFDFVVIFPAPNSLIYILFIFLLLLFPFMCVAV